MSDEPLPRLISIPTEGEWECLGEVCAGDVREFALAAQLYRNGTWVECNMSLCAHGASWDPLRYATHWHRADFGANFLQYLGRAKTKRHLEVLGALADSPAEVLFGVLRSAIYDGKDAWSRYAGAALNEADLDAWGERLMAASRDLEILDYWGDVPQTWLVPCAKSDRLVFRESVTSTVHEVVLPPGAGLKVVAEFADLIENVSSGGHGDAARVLSSQ